MYGASLLFVNVWPCKDAWETPSKRGDALNCSRFIILIHPFVLHVSPLAPPVMLSFVNHLLYCRFQCFEGTYLKLFYEGFSDLLCFFSICWIFLNLRKQFFFHPEKLNLPKLLQIFTCVTSAKQDTLKTDVFSPHSTPPACGRSIWPTADQIPTTLPPIRRHSSADVSEVLRSSVLSSHLLPPSILFLSHLI